MGGLLLVFGVAGRHCLYIHAYIHVYILSSVQLPDKAAGKEVRKRGKAQGQGIRLPSAPAADLAVLSWGPGWQFACLITSYQRTSGTWPNCPYLLGGWEMTMAAMPLGTLAMWAELVAHMRADRIWFWSKYVLRTLGSSNWRSL